MSFESLPERPDLDQLRRQAKELLTAARAGDTAAVERIRRQVGESDAVTLATAQRVIAREFGIPSWSGLKAEVETRTHDLAGGSRRFCGRASAGWPRTGRPDCCATTRGSPGFDVRTAVILGDAERVRR